MKGKDIKKIIQMHVDAYLNDEVEYSLYSVGKKDEIEFKIDADKDFYAIEQAND